MPKGFLASMAHDILAGKPIEVEHLSGVVVRLGKESSVATPSHTFITQALAPFADGKSQVSDADPLVRGLTMGDNDSAIVRDVGARQRSKRA